MSKNIIEKKFFKSGSLKSITYFNEIGKKHRKNGPAHLTYYANGKLKSSKYFKNGKYHRANGPSETYYNKNGLKIYEKYSIDGKLNRLGDNPSIIHYKDGSIVHQYYYTNNKKNRIKNLPSELSFFLNGELSSIGFYINDKPRESGPYSIDYYQSGQVECEYYTNRGDLILGNDLPDVIYYHENGNLKSEYYYINGENARSMPEEPSLIEYNVNGDIIKACYTNTQGNEYRQDMFRDPVCLERYEDSLKINKDETKYNIGAKGMITLKEYNKLLKEYEFDENPENLTDEQIEYLKLIYY